jgi:hypothetical protein
VAVFGVGCAYFWSVNKQELARLLADYVDALVHRLIKGSKHPPVQPSEERSAAAGASTPKVKP